VGVIVTDGVGVMVWVNEEVNLLNEKLHAINTNKPNRIIIFFIFSLWLLQAEALIRFLTRGQDQGQGQKRCKWSIHDGLFYPSLPYDSRFLCGDAVMFIAVYSDSVEKCNG
jgi:hypothetical protein